MCGPKLNIPSTIKTQIILLKYVSDFRGWIFSCFNGEKSIIFLYIALGSEIG